MIEKHKLIIHPFAELDLEDSMKYYDLQQDGLGLEFVAEIKKTIKRIEEDPFQFPKEKQARKALVERFPFVVFFYVKDFLITVFVVFHSSRNPKIWKKRIG